MSSEGAGPSVPAESSSAPRGRLSGWGWSIAISVLLTPIYLANRAEPLGSEDTVPAELMPLAILRGDGPFLDRYAPILAVTHQTITWAITRSHGHLVSRYPIGPAILQLPVTAVRVAILDRVEPGWDRNVGRVWVEAKRMSKLASGLIGVLTAVAVHRLLRRLGIGPMAVPATLAAAFGSDLWLVGSQAPWEHGSAALALTLALICLTPRQPSRLRLLLGGLATAVMVCCRPVDLVFAVAILLRVAVERPRALAWFLPAPVLLGSLLIAYNYWYFGSVAGGHDQLEALHSQIHGRTGAWSGDLFDGLAGTLLSPNRGLFVFSPWIVVALATLPAWMTRLRNWPLGAWLSVALVVDLLVLSKYVIWWGGHSFGPRYWTDAIPIFAVFLGFGLDWAWSKCRPVVVVFALTIVLSIVFQAVGAICYPSSWNGSPVDVDRKPARVWDWSDTELMRCLREGPKQWTEFPFLR
jgi:hypothetical protein